MNSMQRNPVDSRLPATLRCICMRPRVCVTLEFGAEQRCEPSSITVSSFGCATVDIVDLHVLLAGSQPSADRSDHRNAARCLDSSCENAADCTIARRNPSHVGSREVA